jgi:hypothetical protein
LTSRLLRAVTNLRIDQTHKKWAIATAALFATSLVIYVLYALRAAQGPRGGSVIGLIYGITGFALMIFAALLSLRKKFPIWRIGRAQNWMRGHLWLGLLSYPLILFHAGFSMGGALTSVLLLLLTLVIVSGLLGAVLQHYMPRIITERVAMETIYDQIDRVRTQLVAEADQLKEAFSPTLQGLLSPSSVGERRTAVLTLKLVKAATRNHLSSVYASQIRPFLATSGGRGHVLSDERESLALFSQLRTLTPQMLHDVFDDLENICQEKRDLDRQTRYHRILHGWLLAHIPLSAALIVLGFIHAFAALRY